MGDILQPTYKGAGVGRRIERADLTDDVIFMIFHSVMRSAHTSQQSGGQQQQQSSLLCSDASVHVFSSFYLLEQLVGNFQIIKKRDCRSLDALLILLEGKRFSPLFPFCFSPMSSGGAELSR